MRRLLLAADRNALDEAVRALDAHARPFVDLLSVDRPTTIGCANGGSRSGHLVGPHRRTGRFVMAGAPHFAFRKVVRRMDNRMTLGVVHIVEWLRSTDVIRTGWDLFNELEPLGIVSKPSVPVNCYRVDTRAEFLALLQRFEDEYRQTGRSPVLQIETHGGKYGIGGDEGIEWPELMEALVPLNRLSRLNLVIILAACEGFYGVQMLQPDRRAAAFRGLIGPHEEVSTGSLQKAVLAFYRTLFRQLDGDSALKAMNDAVDTSRETFWLISAEDAFKIVNRSHFLEHCTPEALDRRRDRLISRAARRYRARYGLDASQQLAQQWFAEATAHLLDQRGLFERLRREYFFINAYPENNARFDVTFEQCWPDGMELRID